MEIYSYKFGHMTMMAAMTIYGKNPSKIFFSETIGPIALKLGMYHWGLRPIIICSNDGPGLTLTYFMPMSNLVTYAFVWEKVKGLSTGQVEAKLHMKPLWDGGMEDYLNGPGHMTKMATMPIYGKNP